MIFNRSLTTDLIEHGRRFTFQNLQMVPVDAIGVYVFTHRRSFIYVGKSEGTGLGRRLIAHYRNTHNDLLSSWIRGVTGDMRFTYLRCDEGDADDLERSLIQHLHPKANEVRYPNYTPKHTLWRKTRG